MRYREGDKVKIKLEGHEWKYDYKTRNHGFRRGEIVTIVKAYDDVYSCTNANGIYWSLDDYYLEDYTLEEIELKPINTEAKWRLA